MSGSEHADLIKSGGAARPGEGWEEIDLLNVVTVCEEHGEPVYADAPARGGRQAVLQGGQEVLVQEHRLVVPARLGKGRGHGGQGEGRGVERFPPSLACK